MLPLEGERFGHLKVIRYDKEKKKWECQCDCGNTTFVPSRNLRSGNTKSCGCMRNAKGIKKQRQKNHSYLLYKDVGKLRIIDVDENKETVTCFCLQCKKNTIELPIDEVKAMRKSQKQHITCGIDGCNDGTKRKSSSIQEGEKFGRLTVEQQVETKVYKTKRSLTTSPMFLCKCECGNTVEVEGRYLLSGRKTNCGCRDKRRTKKYSNILATENGKLLYKIFRKWKMKFSSPTEFFKKNVIDAGIKFFPELDGKDNAFELFYQWAITTGFEKEAPYLERVNYLKDFSSNNCYFTNRKTKGY